MFNRSKGGVDASGAEQLIAAGASIVDVREQAEWDAGRIPGAVHVPLGELAERHSEIPRETRLVVVCRSGARSSRAAGILLRLGFDVVNLDGGMKSWKANGLPMDPADGVVA